MHSLARTIGAALGLWLLSIASAVAAQFVVIESTSSNYTPGTILEVITPVTISEGERLTVVTESGETRTIRGPFNEALENEQRDGGNGSNLIESLAKFLASDERRTRLAVVRARAAVYPDDPFLLPTDAGGRFCVRDRSVYLWRANSSEAQTLIVKEFGGQADVMRIPWPAGDDRIAWPARLPPQDGKTYVLGLSGGARARQIHVVLLNGGAPTTAHEVARLADHECFRQARSLLQTLLPGD